MSVPTFTTPAPPAPSEQFARFTEADLATAREQEKSKLYPQLSQLQEEVARLKAVADQAAAAEQAHREAQQAAQLKAEQEEQERLNAELSARELFEKQNNAWEERFAQLERQRQLDQAMLQKEQEMRELLLYTEQAKAANADQIMPHLLPLVRGNTFEEIDASIAGLVATTASILEDVASTATATRTQQVGTRPYGGPSEVPLENYTQQELDPAAIAAMPLSDWVNERQKYGLGQTTTGRGLLG